MPKRFKVDGQVIEVGEVVEYGGQEVTFRGRLEGGAQATPGLWIDPATGGFLLVERPRGSEIRSMLKTLSRDPRSRLSSAVIDDSPPPQQPERLSSDELLRFDVHQDDDDMVRAVKEAVNASRLTVRSVSEGVPGGYNLIYGLRKRHSIKYESLQKWCELLRLRAEVRLVPIKRV